MALLRSVRELESVPPAEFIPRDEFLAEMWDYTPGEHVTLLAPTQWGKTTLAYQLLQRTTRPTLPGIVLVMKPRDATVKRWNDELKYRIVRNWPPPPTFKKPNGWTVWPRHTFDIETDDAHLEAVFRKCIRDSYRRGNRILFCDEIVGLSKELDLEQQIVAVHTRGAAMGTGVWAASQRPYYAPLTCYSQAEHLFLGRDPDARDRKRFGEIGGIDPYLVDRETMRLERYQWLYIRRTGPQICIVGQ